MRYLIPVMKDQHGNRRMGTGVGPYAPVEATAINRGKEYLREINPGCKVHETDATSVTAAYRNVQAHLNGEGTS